jgi:hypothetical protein
LPADQQLKLIGDRLKEIPNPADRSTASLALLGKEGVKLIEAADKLKDMKDRAEALGLALSAVDSEALQDAGDSIDKLGFMFDGVLKKAAAAIAPYIIAIADALEEAILSAGGFEQILASIIDTLKLVTKAAAIMLTFFAAAKLTAGLIAAVTALTRMYAAIKVATSAAAILNTVLGKNPLIKIAAALMAIGATVKVLEEVDEMFADLDKRAQGVMTGINVKVDEQKKKTGEVVDVNKQLNALQEKALEALGEFITKLGQQVEYQRNILKYGQEEADIQKTVAEEREKLKKAGVEMLPAQEASIRNLMAEEASLKRQVQLREEQAATLKEQLYNQSALTTEINKLSDIQLQFELKLDQKAINEARNQMLLAIDPDGKKAMENQRKRINDTVNAELAKYDPMLVADQNYEKAKTQLNLISEMARLNQIKLTSEQINSLKTAELQLEKDYALEKIKIAEQTASKLEQIELDRITRELMAQKGAMAESLSADDRAVLQKIGQQERQKAIVAERIAFEKKSEFEKAQFGIDAAAQMFSALGAQNKKAFEAAKAFNIANAIMNTYMAATKALATYPFPFGLIAAAGAVAAGMAQVGAIRSQQYSGRALGGPVMASQSYVVGENGPELFTPATTGRITRNSDMPSGGGVTNINFTIVANDTTGFDQLLTSRKGVIQQIISDAMLERGQRSMM